MKMNYFILKQDRDLKNAIELEGFNNSEKMILLKNNLKETDLSRDKKINLKILP